MGDVQFCRDCGTNTEYRWTSDCCLVCSECGLIDPSARIYVDALPTEQEREYPLDPCPESGQGRYREIFHWNERISQFNCNDPLVPDVVYSKLKEAADSGKYGSPRDFTRSSVLIILRELKLQKYRERWRTLLFWLNGQKINFIEPELVEIMNKLFKEFVISFGGEKGQMVTGNKKERKSFMSYSYVMRKILEFCGTYDYHWDIPLPRSYKKLHALDDMMKIIFDKFGYPFVRSTVIKRPKFRC